jgi:hypothetical protein
MSPGNRVPMAMAIGRIAFGLAMMIAPRLAGRVFLGAEVDRPSVRFMSRIFGIRDLAVGAVLLFALRGDRDVAPALWLGVACDAWDAKTAFASRGGLTRPGRWLVMTAGSSYAATGAAQAIARTTGRPDASDGG